MFTITHSAASPLSSSLKMFSRLTSYFRDETVQNNLQELMKRLAHLRIDGTVRVGQVRATGGFADVYDGTARIPGAKEFTKVAIKKFRVIVGEEDKFDERFERELLIWSNLKYDNVLPLLDVMTMHGFPCMVSVWMANGTMSKYLKTHNDVNLLDLVQGIADGLGYLHECEVVHSDLTSHNVLISEGGRAILADFGTSRLLLNGVTIAGTQTLIGNARWSAPELLQTTKAPTSTGHLLHTQVSDTWAFGMVVYEALRREVPFYDCADERQVVSPIIEGKLPPKPDGVGIGVDEFELLWDCCQRCWGYEPESRPSMRAIRAQLKCKVDLLIEDMRTVTEFASWMSSTGRFLAIHREDRKLITFLETRKMRKCGPGLTIELMVWSFAWSNTEEHIITVSKDGIMQKWSNVLETPVVVARSKQGDGSLGFEFSPDDRFIASFNLTAKLFDASNLSLIWEYPGFWSNVAFRPLGNRLAFTDWGVLEVNIEDLENITTTKHNLDSSVSEIVFDPSGNTCIAETSKGVEILSGDTFDERDSLPFNGCMAMRLTPNGKYILFVLSESEKAVLWNVAAGEAVEELSLPVDIEPYEKGHESISKNCRIIELRTKTRSLWKTHILRLTSSYY